MPEVKALKTLVFLDPGLLPEYMRWYEFLLCSPHFDKKRAAFFLSQDFNRWLQLLQEVPWAVCGNRRSRRESISLAFHWDHQTTWPSSKAPGFKEQDVPFNFRSSTGSPVLLIPDLLLHTQSPEGRSCCGLCKFLTLRIHLYSIPRWVSVPQYSWGYSCNRSSFCFSHDLGNFQAWFNLNTYPYF